MAFQLSAEQNEFATSVRRFFEGEVGLDSTKKWIEKGRIWNTNLHTSVCNFGLFALFGMADESNQPGGVELYIIAREAGRALFPWPLVDCLVAGPYLHSSVRPGALSTGCAAAGISPESLAEGGVLGVVALDHGDGDLFLPAQMPIRFLIRVKGDRVGFLPYESVSAAAVQLESIDRGHPVLKISDTVGVGSVVEGLSAEDVRSALYVGKAAELCGIADRVVSMTTEYVKTRKQFDAPIGSFQAVQQKLADMYLHAQSMDALTRFGAWSLKGSPDQAALASRAALSYACEHAPVIAESAIQLHGGIGFTWEYDLHLFLRRAKAIQTLHGLPQSERQAMLRMV